MSELNNRQLYARLLGHVKPYKWAFAGAVIAMAVGGAVQGLFALFLNTLLKGLFAEGGESYALYGAIGIVLIFFVSGMSLFLAGYGMQYVGTKVIMDLRNLMFRRLIRLPESLFSKTTTGTLMAKVTYDVMGLQEASSNALNALVRGVLTLVVAIATMFYLSWKLTLIVFVTLPILAYVITVFGKRLRHVSRQSQVAQAAITDVLQESVRGHRVIKIFGGEKYESARFDGAANQLRKLSMKHAAAAAAGTPFTHLVVSIAIALIVYLAASKHLGTGLALADFVTYVVAAAGLVPQIKAITTVSEQIQKGLASAESVFSLIDSPAEEDRGTTGLDRVSGAIKFDNVSLVYENQPTPALDNVSLDISAGETIALVGPSGGGKTSFVNLISRFFSPTAGRITLDGHALSDIKLADLRRQMALVSQDVVLFNDTVAANIAYGATGTPDKKKIEDAARAANCLDFIQALPQGFDTGIGDNGSRLSGGQRQRLAIARAIFKDAPILLLDEATSALDSESERAVQEALEALMRGRTTIVVAHRLSTIEGADRIVVMDGGRIAEVGKHHELIARNGLYAGLYKLQFAA
jgi:ATP-binding cassette, subfamily B, bacterial MsbA